MIKIQDLRAIGFFKEFPDTQLAEIVPSCISRIYSKGETVSREDDPATHLYFLSQGMMDVVIQLPGGKPVSALTIRPGEMFGWSGLVKPYRYTSSAIAKEASVVITLEASVVKKLFQKNTELGFKMMEEIASTATARLRDTRKQLLEYIYQQTS
jgi:CRP/FNR family transcriptional regulator, cyclic AMP receptor protein